jgi:D-tyrosyl-tRNA(Tyr) deacylase
MRLLLQRVKQATVEVDHRVIASIDMGILAFLGIHVHDDVSPMPYLIDKLIHLRIFGDAEDKMNRSLIEVGGSVLLVSQFTLYADCKVGRRPSFIESAKPTVALKLYRIFHF